MAALASIICTIFPIGIAQELLFKHSPLPGKYPLPNDVGKLDLEHFYTLCFLMVAGLLIGTFVLLVECCLKQTEKSVDKIEI